MTHRFIAGAALIVLGCAACSSPSSTMQEPHRVSAPAVAPLVPMTAGQLVETLAREGLEVDHPADTTVNECAQVGCVQSIVTDRFRLLTFPTTGAAQIYAGRQKMRQVETIVVGFAPVVPDDKKDQYWSAIVDLAH